MRQNRHTLVYSSTSASYRQNTPNPFVPVVTIRSYYIAVKHRRLMLMSSRTGLQLKSTQQCSSYSRIHIRTVGLPTTLSLLADTWYKDGKDVLTSSAFLRSTQSIFIRMI